MSHFTHFLTWSAMTTLLLLTPPARAEGVFFPARLGNMSAELVIAGVTDLEAVMPIINDFQDQNPSVSAHYIEMTSNELSAKVEAACQKEEFFADLIISSSAAQQVKHVNDGCAQPLSMALSDRVPDWARWRNELVSVGFEPGVIVYNKNLLSPSEVPGNRFDLVDLLRQSQRFNKRIGTYDIISSGVGYIFAFEDAAQASTWGRLVESFGRNDVQLFCCTSEILDRVADGRLTLGYNVLGSYALSRSVADPRIGVIFPSDYTLVLPRSAFISRQARSAAAALNFIDFSLAYKADSLLFRINEKSKPEALESLRPIALTPALLVGLDKAKKNLFLHQWSASVVSSK